MSQHDHHNHHAPAATAEHDHAAVSHPQSEDERAPAAGQSGHGHADHGGHAGHGDHVARFRRLFWIMLLLAVPVVGFSTMFSMLIGYPLPAAAWVEGVSPILGTVMYVWGGAPFLTETERGSGRERVCQDG